MNDAIRQQFDPKTGEYIETQVSRTRNYSFAIGNSRSDARIAIYAQLDDYLKDIYDHVHKDGSWSADLTGSYNGVKFSTNTSVCYRGYKDAISAALSEAEVGLVELLARVRQLKSMHELTEVMPEFGENND